MDRVIYPVRVSSGTCLSHVECNILPPGAIPVGEEVTEQMSLTMAEPRFYVRDPDSTLIAVDYAPLDVDTDAASASAASNEPSHTSPVDWSAAYSPVRVSVHTEKNSTIPIVPGGICNSPYTHYKRQSTISNSHMSRQGSKSTVTHSRRSSAGDARRRSLNMNPLPRRIVSPSQTIFPMESNQSLPNLTVFMDRVRSESDENTLLQPTVQVEGAEANDEMDDSNSEFTDFQSAKPLSPTPSTPSFYPSAVWWLEESSSSMGNVNRKAMLNLGTSPDDGNLFDLDIKEGESGPHLLLPGRSNFEDELVREVAHFELSEYLIGQLEYLKSMDLVESLETQSNVPTTSQLGVDTSKSTFGRSVSNLGLLTYMGPQNFDQSLIPDAAQQLRVANNSSPFADLFGSVQQGDFLDNGPCDDSVEASKIKHRNSDFHLSPANSANDPSGAGYPTLKRIIRATSSVNTESLLTQSRSVTSLAADLVTRCMECWSGDRIRIQFLKPLHQLLMQTCDADWALQDRVSEWTNMQRPRSNMQLLTRQPLLPSNSAVMLMASSEHLTDSTCTGVIPLGALHGNRRRSRPRSHSETGIHGMTHPPNQANQTTQSVQSDTPPDVRVELNSCSFEPRIRQPLAHDRRNRAVPPRLFDCEVDSNYFACPTDTIGALCTPLPYSLLTSRPIPKARRKSILLTQDNRCAGCGAFVETRYVKQMRFCEFFGQFFCCVCHLNTLMVVPGSVLTSWDFRMVPVSNIARDRLQQLHRQPLLRLADIDPRVLQKQTGLRNCSVLRRQGHLILPFVRFCPDARDLMTHLKALPRHWLESPNLWSMADLNAVRDGQLDTDLRRALQPVVDHLTGCTRCRSQGFVCEVCHSGHILFPFGQPNTVTCPACTACFHRQCLRNPQPESCPRCVRRTQRRKQHHNRDASVIADEEAMLT